MIKRFNEKIRQNDLYDAFITFEILTVLVACLTQSFFDKLTPLLHALMYGILFIYFVLRLYRMILLKQKPDIEFYALIVFACISTATMLIDHYSVKGSIIPSMGYFSQHIFAVSTLILMYLASNSRVSVKAVKSIVFAVCLVSVVYSLYYIFFKRDAYYYINRVSPYLTFGLSNPNKTGVMLFMFFLVMVFGVFITKNPIIKSAYGGMAVILFVLTYKTKSRTVLIAVMFFAAMIIWLLIKKKPRFKSILWIAVAFIPILFSTLYMMVVNTDVFNKLFSFIISDGKGLSSRYKVWRQTIEIIKNNPITGSYFDVNNTLMLTNTHNTHFHIIASYGVIAYLPFAFINCFTFTKANRICSNKLSTCAMIATASILLIGMAESLIFSGSTGLFMFLGLFMAMAHSLSELPEWTDLRTKFNEKNKK